MTKIGQLLFRYRNLLGPDFADVLVTDDARFLQRAGRDADQAF